MAINPNENQGFVTNAGRTAFREAYDRLAAEAKARKEGIQADYGDMYSQLRNQQYAQSMGAAAQRGLSGGQAQGVAGRMSAQQVQALGQLGSARQRAMSEADARNASIYSNALLEGQQAEEYSQRQQQSLFDKQMAINNIVNKKGDFSGYNRTQQFNALLALGLTAQQANSFLGLTREQQIENVTNQVDFGGLNPGV